MPTTGWVTKDLVFQEQIRAQFEDEILSLGDGQSQSHRSLHPFTLALFFWDSSRLLSRSSAQTEQHITNVLYEQPPLTAAARA